MTLQIGTVGTGVWGHLVAEDDVVVGHGGTFDCHGYIRGSAVASEVRAVSCGNIDDLFVVRNRCSSSQIFAMYGVVLFR